METKEFSKPYSNLRDFRDQDLRNLNLEGNEIQ